MQYAIGKQILEVKPWGEISSSKSDDIVPRFWRYSKFFHLFIWLVIIQTGKMIYVISPSFYVQQNIFLLFVRWTKHHRKIQ